MQPDQTPPAIGGRPPLPRVALAAGTAVLLVTLLGGLAYTRLQPPPERSLTCASQSSKVASLFSDDRTTAIRVSNPDLSNLTVVRTEPADILPGLFEPLLTLSGDGSRLAYVTAKDEAMDDAHIWSVDVAKPGRPQPLAAVPRGFWVVKPVWSADANHLAYIKLNDQQAVQGRLQYELWVAQLNGQPHKVTNLDALQPDFFSGNHTVPLCWAVDNRTLIFDGAIATGGAAAGQAASVSLAATTTGQSRTALSIAGQTGAATTSSAASSVSLVVLPGAVPPPTAAGAAAQQTQIDSVTGKTYYVRRVVQLALAKRDNAPPSPSGSQCGLTVMSQQDPRWRQALMQQGGDDIGNYGCALTSTTMVLNYYGAALTPDQLSHCLGAGADYLAWSAVPGCAGIAVNFAGRPDFSWPTLDASLKNGPAIVGMLHGQTGMHFVVVTAGSGGNAANYAVTDPWDATTTKSLQTFIGSGYNPAWIAVYTGPPRDCTRAVPPPSLAFSINGVTDGAIYKQPVQLSVSGAAAAKATLVTLSFDYSGGSVAPAGAPASRDVTAGATVSDDGIYETVVVGKGANGSSALSRVKFTIDRTPPVLGSLVVNGKPQDPAESAVFRGAANVSVFYQDTLSGVAAIQYQLDRGKWQPFGGDTRLRWTIAVVTPGAHALAFKASDLAGNESPATNFSFQVLPADGGSLATATPSPTPAPPTATPAPPTATPAPTAVPSPNATPTPPATTSTTSTTQSNVQTSSTTHTTSAAQTSNAATSAGAPPTATPTTAPTATSTPTASPSPTPVLPTATATVAPPTATATAVPVAKPVFSAAELDFGPLALGNNGARSITLSNGGSAPLVMSSIAIGGANAADFTLDVGSTSCSTGGALPLGAFCVLGVVFHPSAPGTRSATLTIADNTPGGHHSVALSGAGAQPTATPTQVAVGGCANGSVDAAREQQVIAGINQARAAAGIKAMVTDSRLTAVARARSNCVIGYGVLTHCVGTSTSCGPAGYDFVLRLGAAGVGYAAASENLGMDNGPASNIVASWLGSAVHRGDALNPLYRSTGVGAVCCFAGTYNGRQLTDADGVYVYVELFTG